MEYQDEILCFTGAAVINIAPVPQKEHFYDATGGPFTHSKVNKYLELYTDYKSVEREEQIEAVLDDHGIFYEKSEVWIETENLYEVLYEMEV